MNIFKKNLVFIFQIIIILSLSFGCSKKQDQKEVSDKTQNYSKEYKKDKEGNEIVLYCDDYLIKEEHFEITLILPPNWQKAPQRELNNRRLKNKDRTGQLQLVGFIMRKSGGNIPNISILTNYILNPEINSVMDYVKYIQKNPYIKVEEKPKEILLANKNGIEFIYKIRASNYISYYFYNKKTILIISAEIDPDKFITEKEEIKEILGTFTFKRITF